MALASLDGQLIVFISDEALVRLGKAEAAHQAAHMVLNSEGCCEECGPLSLAIAQLLP
jgi:hypothetical protein